MTPDDDLRSRLDRLVTPPDSGQGWETVRVRSRQSKRRHDTIMGSLAALVVVLLVGGLVVGLGSGGPAQNVNAVDRPTSSTSTTTTVPSTTTTPGLITTTTPSLPIPGGTTIPGATTPNGGGTGGATNPGSSTGGAAGTTTPGGATSVPNGGTTVPQSGGTTVPGRGPTTTVAALTLDEVQNALQAKYSGRSVFRSLQRSTINGTPVVAIHLRADAVQTAVEIDRQWPGQTAVYLGFFPFTKGAASPSAPCGSGLLPTDVALPLGLTATNDVPAAVAAGHDFGGTLTVTNGGKSIVDVTAGSHALVTIFKPGGAIAGCLDGAVTSDATRSTLNPGDTARIPLIGGTASSSRGSWAIPAGAYFAVAHIQVGTTDVTYRFPITVT